MSTYTSEPGTRLAGRYRLVDQVNEGAGWTYWKATDEALARFLEGYDLGPPLSLKGRVGTSSSGSL